MVGAGLRILMATCLRLVVDSIQKAVGQPQLFKKKRRNATHCEEKKNLLMSEKEEYLSTRRGVLDYAVMLSE